MCVGKAYDSKRHCIKLVRCTEKKGVVPSSLTIGKMYWLDVSTAQKDSNGDEYAQVYLDSERSLLVGNLLTSHFEVI